MFNSVGVIRRWPLANYVSSMHLPDTSDCINLSPSSASSNLHFVVWPILIYHNSSCIMHSYIAVMKIYSVSVQELMLCVILAYGVN